MGYLDKYKNMMDFNKYTDEKNPVVNVLIDEINYFNEYITYAPNRQVLKKYNSNEEIVCTIQDVSFNSKKYGDEKIFCTYLDTTLKVGEILVWNNTNMIITNEEQNTIQSHRTFIGRPCTLQLSFLNSKGDICTYPVIEESATKYSDGISDNGKVRVADNQRVMSISLTDDTRDFKVGKRFLFDRNHAFEISFDGLNKENSLKEIMLTQTQIHEDVDNLDLLIADYYGNAHEYAMEILNKNIEMNTNNQCILQISVYDKGIKIDNPLLEFTVADNTIIKVENNTITSLKEGTTHITVKFKDIIQTVNVNIKNVPINGNYTCEIIGEDTIALGTSEVYEYKLYTNGNEVKLPIVWTLTDENNKPTTYGMLNNLIDNKCTINIYDTWIFDDGYKKYVYLHCKSEKCNEIIKQIKITQF